MSAPSKFTRSPLGLYFIDGIIVQSDVGPEDALQFARLNEPQASLDLVGAIFPDSAVRFDSNPEHPVLFFNAKTWKLQPENISQGKVLGLGQLFAGPPWVAYYDSDNAVGLLSTSAFKEKPDALMAAFEALQG